MRLWGHIVKTNQIFEYKCKPHPHFRLKVVCKMEVDSRDHGTVVVVIAPYASESRIHSHHRTTEWLGGVELSIQLFASVTVYTV